MSNRELPMMPWFPKEFAAATSTWSFAERSAYRALLDVQWELGTIPDESWRLAQAIGMPLEEFEAIWPMVRRKFQPYEGELRNERLEEHRVIAFRKLQAHKHGAEVTNAKRSANRHGERDAERDAERIAQRNGKRLASDSPPSPSPSSQNPPKPPVGGLNGHSAVRSEERKRKDASRQAWVKAEIARKANDFEGLRNRDPTVAEAIRLIGGFAAIGMTNTDRMGTIRARFREAFEQLLEREANPP